MKYFRYRFSLSRTQAGLCSKCHAVITVVFFQRGRRLETAWSYICESGWVTLPFVTVVNRCPHHVADRRLRQRGEGTPSVRALSKMLFCSDPSFRRGSDAVFFGRELLRSLRLSAAALAGGLGWSAAARSDRYCQCASRGAAWPREHQYDSHVYVLPRDLWRSLPHFTSRCLSPVPFPTGRC